MDYSLAKELKDAGLPQHHDTAYGRKYQFDREDDLTFVHQGGIGRTSIDNAHDEGDITLLPTLEELIEACGSGFDVLSRDVSEGEDKVVWLCNNYADPASILIDRAWVEGATPTEAVARLWLALNKK